MQELLQKEIENHLAAFPERWKDVVEIRSEWKEFKSKALLILIGFISTILGIGIWVGTIQTNIANINVTANKAATQAEDVQRRVSALEITNGEIRAKLSSIEATLQEIKVAIRQLNY